MMINGFRDTLFLEKPISPFVKYKNCPVIWLIHETSTPPQHQRTKVFDAQQIPGVAASVSWWPDDGTFLAMHWGFVQQQGWIGILQRFFCNVQDFDIFHSLGWFNWLHICINDLWHSPWFNDSMPSPRPCVYTSKEHPKTNRCKMLNQANRWVLWAYGPHPLVSAPG